MQCVFALDAAIFFYFQPVGRIFLILLGRITRYTRKAAVLAFSAFQRYYDAIAFTFCHFLSPPDAG